MSLAEELLSLIAEAAGQIASFAKQSGRSEEEVEKLWLEIKDKLIKDGMKETEEKFFPILVTILKRKLGI